MNPESLDLSIQSALSALFPPFEATAPIVLSQLFRTIDERYHGDALQCLLDFLIPSKHLLESVQQAACAGFSDVVFRCEGWPLCLHDKTVIQLAPVNPLLLRPGDFYLQVEPFGDQAARIVLKSLLEEGCREVEETPIPETSYPCMFTEDWLQDINEGRQGTPLSRCLLCTDQGVIKLPWAKIAVPEFLDKPKIMPSCREPPPEPKKFSGAFHFHSATLPLEAMVFAAKDRMSASLRPADSSSRLVKVDQERRAPKSCPKPLIKPVGWVSPNSWDSHNYQEIEGDYVDLVDIGKGKEFKEKPKDCHPNPLDSLLLKPVRPPPPVPSGNSAFCGQTLQYRDESCIPCSQKPLSQEILDLDLKCRYRDSYLAALKNPVAFEKGSVDLLAALEEVGLPEEGGTESRGQTEAQQDPTGNFSKHFMLNVESRQCKHCHEATSENSASHPSSSSESENPFKQTTGDLKSTPCLSHGHRAQMKPITQQSPHVCVRPVTDVPLASCDGEAKPQQKGEGAKPSGKHKVKTRSLSTVSETALGSPLLYKLNNRSHSDICPETITSLIHCKRDEVQGTPKLDRQRSPKKEFLSSRDEITAGTSFKLLNLKTEKSPAQQANLPSTPETQLPPQNEEYNFKRVSGLLELGIICLPGSRDRTGRAVVEVYGDRKEWKSPLLSAQTICELLLYLHSVPRKEVGELGMTLIINAKKKPPPPHFYKALLMAQEQALHAVHSIVMLMDKDTFPRPEKQPGLQMDMVTTMKALNKTVEACQLTADLGGTFMYSHKDWLQFHQKLASFLTDLREADYLLQRAIKKVDSRRQMDTAQEVQQCIQEQKVSMKEVLEDARLVMLQREGGALLARMKREFKFPQSEDYRDALESVTSLYNQVEEKLHTLVMRSNESLQHLDFLFRLRETESKITTTGVWFSTEGEEGLKASYTTEDNLMCTENALKHFHLFLTQSKEKKQYALTLVTEAEKIVGTSGSSPQTDIFRTLVSTFKSNVEDFMLRAEQRNKELNALVQVYSFCQKVSALTEECSRFMEQVEHGCYSVQTPNKLQIYEERLGGEFSTQHFQAVKAKVCSVGSGASGATRVWNAAWVQCQEVRHRLEEMRKKKRGVDKDQTQQPTAASSSAESGGVERDQKGSEAGEDERSPPLQTTSPQEEVKIAKSAKESISVVSPGQGFKTEFMGDRELKEPQLPEPPAENEKRMSWVKQCSDCHSESIQKSREHCSEADLSNISSRNGCKEFPLHQPLGRSLSEGSYAGSHPTSIPGLTPLIVSHRHCQSRKQPLELNLLPVQNLPTSHDQNVWPENLKCSSKRDSTEAEAEGRPVSPHGAEDARTPGTLLTPTDNESNVLKVRRILEELLSTEREYVKALGYVREHYFPELERADVPQDLRGQRGSIFGNLEKLHDFHRHHFQDELQSCVSEPFRVGRCFLRHRESFALYALYSKNKPQSDSLLINHGQTFFKQKQQKLGDKMDLWSYLLKPVQRISKYSLLLQDLMRECDPTQTREIAEVKAALEVVHFQLRHGNNLLAMDAIHHCDVNLKEQGQLIRQDEFLVTFRKKKCFRHIFLFQELILFSKTRKTDIGNDTYIYKQSFKTSDVGMTQNTGESGLCFEIWFRKRKSQDTYTLQAASREVKEAWTRDLERILWEQAIHNREVRMQERVFLGIGNKPFMDIQPSEAAISDRAINYVLLGRENKALSSAGPCGSHSELPGGRPKSVGSGSCSSSSSSSGRGSLVYLCGPKRRVVSGGPGGYVSPPGALEDDDLDHENGNQNLLLDSSESSGESVSGFSSSSHSYQSAVGGESEDSASVCGSVITVKEAAAAQTTQSNPVPQKPNILAEKTQPAAANKRQHQSEDQTAGKVQSASVGKSTEV